MRDTERMQYHSRREEEEKKSEEKHTKNVQYTQQLWICAVLRRGWGHFSSIHIRQTFNFHSVWAHIYLIFPVSLGARFRCFLSPKTEFQFFFFSFRFVHPFSR